MSSVITRVSSLAVGAQVEAASGVGGFWTVAALLGLLVVAGASIRLVGSEERAVVSRFGRVTRVRGPGVVLRLPAVERVMSVSMHPIEMPLVVSATTRDGVTVRVIATAVGRPSDPARWATHAAPLDAAALAVEEALQREAGERRLVQLLEGVARVEALVPVQVSGPTAAWGVEIVQIRVHDIETRLTPQLLRVLHGR